MRLDLPRLLLAACLTATLVSIGCSPAGSSSSGNPTVYVDSYPIAYFAERLAGEDALVVFPAPETADPAYWKPSDETIRAYQGADLVLTSGPHYAGWISRASLPSEKVVDTTESFPPDALVKSEEGVVHSHGDEGEHSHETYAIHSWLDPKLAQLQAEAVRAALSELLPTKANEIDRRYAELRSDLADLESRLATLKGSTEEMPLLASHPVYDYLAHAAGWNLKSFHWEPGEMPSEKEWAKLDAYRKETPATWMLWEAEPIEPIQQALEERGIQRIVVRHAGNRPDNGDFLDAMRANYDALAAVTPATTDP